jgi:hypothetical protein
VSHHPPLPLLSSPSPIRSSYSPFHYSVLHFDSNLFSLLSRFYSSSLHFTSLLFSSSPLSSPPLYSPLFSLSQSHHLLYDRRYVLYTVYCTLYIMYHTRQISLPLPPPLFSSPPLSSLLSPRPSPSPISPLPPLIFHYSTQTLPFMQNVHRPVNALHPLELVCYVRLYRQCPRHVLLD